VARGTVYTGSKYGKVYALNAATGAKEWSYTAGGVVGSLPAVANGVVYFGSADGTVHALNAATGAVEWRYTTGNSVLSSPAVVNGTVYVGSDDQKVYAFDLPGGMAAIDRPVLGQLHPDCALSPQNGNRP